MFMSTAARDWSDPPRGGELQHIGRFARGGRDDQRVLQARELGGGRLQRHDGAEVVDVDGPHNMADGPNR